MPCSEIKKEAREALKGKWGKAISIIIVYTIISFIISGVLGIFKNDNIIYPILYLIYVIITIPISFGLSITFLNLKRDENVSAFGFLKEGFSRFGRSWGVSLNILLKLLLPIICFILIVFLLATLAIFNATVGNNTVTSIILILLSISLYIATIVYMVSRTLLYSLAYYIAYDNPELSSKACVLKSDAFMRGNRGNLFLLELSFIGWAILSCITLGIGFLWLLPYVQVSTVCFYEKIVGNKETKEVEEPTVKE